MIDASEVLERVSGFLKTADFRAVRKEISAEITGEPRAAVMRLAFDLVRTGEIGRFFAHELVACHSEALSGITPAEMTRLAHGLSDWGGVDSFCCYLAGPAWREGRIPDRLIHAWARSPDRWWRRAALVATVPLNLKSRGGTGDARRTLAVCERLAADRDDMVVKAMSWALRALAVRDPAAVAQFVKRHDGELAARVMREVRNKLTTGLKNPKACAFTTR